MVFSLEIIDVLMKAHIDFDSVVGRLMPVGLVDIGVKITPRRRNLWVSGGLSVEVD